MRRWQEAEKIEARRLREAGKTAAEIGNKLGRSVHSVREMFKDNRCGVTIDANSNAQVVTCNTRTIRTLADALEAAEVDSKIWEVERWVANIIAAELWQVKVWLRRKVKLAETEAIDSLLARIRKDCPRYVFPPRKRQANPVCVELSLADVHFGKLAWAPETGTHYDLKIARSIHQNAVEDLLSAVESQRIECFLLPVGNDFFHFDTMQTTTTGGTALDADGRYGKVFESGLSSLVAAIESMAAIAPVTVLWVPGNHDYLSSFHVCRELGAWFHRARRVKVEVGHASRKYFRYGASLIGFTHGNEEKHASLPAIMATERASDWAETTHHEWHLGHTHKVRKLSHVSADTYEGCIVRTIPSLSGTDAWHFKHGYIGRRAAEAYLWDKRNGYLGHFSMNHRDN